jgi:SAM-dependent methyltransferase
VHPLRELLEAFGQHAPALRHRLFEQELAVPLGAVGGALRPTDIDRLIAAGLVRLAGEDIVPRVRIDPVEALLVASDLRHHRRQRDFVLGPGPAGFLLARHVRRPVRAPLLDLGTGSGLQALLLGEAGTDALGLDINPRAVDYARFNAELNGRPRLRVEVGDFLGPTPDRRLDRRFGTVVANPPFVLSPMSEITYRDRPLPGDEVGARTVERVTRALARDGTGYLLCNWIDRGNDPDGPPLAWARAAGGVASVSRLGTRDPEAYAEVWTRDLDPEHRPAATAEWAAALRAEGVDRIHVGVIGLRPARRAWLGWRSAPGLSARTS